MRVVGLRLVNFRSYCDTAVEFGPGTTVVVGANATGKTNLLEGAFFGLRGSSPRTRSDDKLITWGEPFTRVTVALEDDRGERHTCEVAYAPRQGRRVRYDGLEVAGLDELRRRSMVFIFVPESLLLVKGSPARRRAHLDVFAAAIDPAYAAALAQLSLALRQRNAQLVAVREGADPAALAPWDAQFAAAAAALDRRRRAVVGRLAGRFAAAAAALAPAGGRYTIELVAQTDAVLGAGGVADEQALLAELRRRRPGEVQRGLSLFGPQRDDLRFLELPDEEVGGVALAGPGCGVDGAAALPAGGRDLRLYGSQGEQRAAVLALLLAEREVAAESGAGAGTLFLDDVMSELDDARRRRLVDLLSCGGQAILTTTNRHYFTEDELARALVVELPLAGERLAPPPVAVPAEPPEDEA
jgi:DNA replication and repair protein RecF